MWNDSLITKPVFDSLFDQSCCTFFKQFVYTPECIILSVVMVVFDLSDERSLSNASRWMADACENADEPVKFLVGTKKDKLVGILVALFNLQKLIVVNIK